MVREFEIICIYDNDSVGLATKLENGDFSININGSFVGIYDTFDSWNVSVGRCYKLCEILELDDLLEDQELCTDYLQEPLTEFEQQLNEYVKSSNFSDAQVCEERFSTFKGLKSLHLRKIDKITKIYLNSLDITNSGLWQEESKVVNLEIPPKDGDYITIHGYTFNENTSD